MDYSVIFCSLKDHLDPKMTMLKFLTFLAIFKVSCIHFLYLTSLLSSKIRSINLFQYGSQLQLLDPC